MAAAWSLWGKADIEQEPVIPIREITA
jgi:hypothetical protein